MTAHLDPHRGGWLTEDEQRRWDLASAHLQGTTIENSGVVLFTSHGSGVALWLATQTLGRISHLTIVSRDIASLTRNFHGRPGVSIVCGEPREFTSVARDRKADGLVFDLGDGIYAPELVDLMLSPTLTARSLSIVFESVDGQARGLDLALRTWDDDRRRRWRSNAPLFETTGPVVRTYHR